MGSLPKLTSSAKMAALLARTLAQHARRGVQATTVSTARYSQKMMPDAIEHATGLEKEELLAIQAGNERLVGCVCEEDATCINFMWLEQGEKKRCECGYWFQ